MGISSYLVLAVNDWSNNYNMIEFVNSLVWYENILILLMVIIFLTMWDWKK